MSVTYIGPVLLTNHYAPQWTWLGDPLPHGARPVELRGRFVWEEAKQVQELVLNPDRRVAFAEHVGVLEPIWTTLKKQREFNGFYLLLECEVSAAKPDTTAPFTPVALTALQLVEDPEIVVAHSARALDNDYGIVGRKLLVQPFWGPDPDGEPFAVPAGGTAFSREYDPRTDHDVRNPATATRRLRIHEDAIA